MNKSYRTADRSKFGSAGYFQVLTHYSIHKIATDMVANATNIFSLTTKNSGLDATLATKFLYDLELNQISKVKTNISSYLALLSS